MTGGRTRIRTRGMWLAALLALALCSCESFTSNKDKKVEENVFPKDYKNRILDQLRLQLPDPKGITGAYVAEPALKPRGAITRYIACLRFNAKDGRGQYQGNKDYAAFFYAGELTQVTEASREMCEGALYQPFPELEKL
jgi:hypothetical protein